MSEVSEEILTAAKVIVELQKELSRAKDKIENLEDFKERMKNVSDHQMLEHERQIAQRNKQNESLRDDMKYWMRVAEERMKIISKNESAQDTISDLQAQVESLKGERNVMTDKFKKSRDDFEMVEQAYQDTCELLDKAEVERLKALARADLYSADIHKLSREIEELKANPPITLDSAIITDLQEQVRQLNLQIEGYEYNLRSIRSAVRINTKEV